MRALAGVSGLCPSCGAAIAFRIGASASLVCPYCRALVARTDRGLEHRGRAGDVVFSDVSLSPGDRGQLHLHPFEVAGRVVLQHADGGTWEEYFVRFDGDRPGWISETRGRWYVTQQVNAPAPDIRSLTVQRRVELAGAAWVVEEIGHGTLVSAEGELPFVAHPGTVRWFADFSGSGGAWATVDYGADCAHPQAFVGMESTLRDLHLQARSGGGSAKSVDLRQFQCPACGASLPRLGGTGMEHIACSSCGAISEIESRRKVAQQSVTGLRRWLPLGRRGALFGVTWTVIGYLRRSTIIAGDGVLWDEYLLYEQENGYRWLVVEKGMMRFGQPVPAGSIDRRPSVVVMDGDEYTLRRASDARVIHVVGEFYRKVVIDEIVRSEHYELGGDLLSCESSEAEVDWTLLRVVSPVEVSRAFGVGAARRRGTDEEVEEE